MSDQEVIMYEAHPAMFRNRPVVFVLVLLLCLVGIGFIIYLIWWLRTLSSTLTVTNQKTTLRTGLLSKNLDDVYHKDVRNIQVRQTFFERICGVGTIGISSAAQSDMEIVARGIPKPCRVKEIIEKFRNG